MTRTSDTPRTRPDGSIDYGFYIDRGRRMRSQAAQNMFRPDRESPRSRRGFGGFFGGPGV